MRMRQARKKIVFGFVSDKDTRSFTNKFQLILQRSEKLQTWL